MAGAEQTVGWRRYKDAMSYKGYVRNGTSATDRDATGAIAQGFGDFALYKGYLALGGIGYLLATNPRF